MDTTGLLHRLWKTPGKAKGMGMLWAATQRCLTHLLPADSSAQMGDTALFCAGRLSAPQQAGHRLSAWADKPTRLSYQA